MPFDIPVAKTLAASFILRTYIFNVNTYASDGK